MRVCEKTPGVVAGSLGTGVRKGGDQPVILADDNGRCPGRPSVPSPGARPHREKTQPRGRVCPCTEKTQFGALKSQGISSRLFPLPGSPPAGQILVSPLRGSGCKPGVTVPLPRWGEGEGLAMPAGFLAITPWEACFLPLMGGDQGWCWGAAGSMRAVGRSQVGPVRKRRDSCRGSAHEARPVCVSRAH